MEAMRFRIRATAIVKKTARTNRDQVSEVLQRSICSGLDSLDILWQYQLVRTADQHKLTINKKKKSRHVFAFGGMFWLIGNSFQTEHKKNK